LLVGLLVVILGVVAVLGLWTPAVPSPYLLPWAAGSRFAVLQGNSQFGAGGNCTSGCSTHNDDSMRYAWDFDLPEGTPVLAARAGTVALTNGNWRPDHCGGLTADQSGPITSALIGNEANFVEIDHGDGTSALYLHLSQVAPAIEEKARTGQPVAQGEILGLSGKTGFTQCVPHLHFQIQNTVRADWFTTSQPISFADDDVQAHAPGGVPAEGQSYISSNTAVSP
jgi:murein DD-endopeptidase MepM/ murein hydrolase activator NlpD